MGQVFLYIQLLSAIHPSFVFYLQVVRSIMLCQATSKLVTYFQQYGKSFHRKKRLTSIVYCWFSENTKSLLIIDDADKMVLDYMRGVSELNNTLDWYKQKDKLLALVESVKDPNIDCRIILASNGSSLFTEDLGSKSFLLFYTKFMQIFIEYIGFIVQIPYKNQRQRLTLLYEFTKETKLSNEIVLEEVVKRLNGHVVRALKCVCEFPFFFLLFYIAYFRSTSCLYCRLTRTYMC
jgi:hypothetical protein